MAVPSPRAWCLRLATSRPLLNPSLIDLPRAKGEGNLRATKSRAREINRPGKYYWIGLLESLLMPVNLRQRLSLYLLCSVPQSCPSSQSRYYLLANHLSKYRFVYCDNARAHRLLRNNENKLVFPQPRTEEKFSLQWSSVVEQLT